MVAGIGYHAKALIGFSWPASVALLVACFVREIERAKPPDAIAPSALGFAIAHSCDGKIRDIPLPMRRARRATELDGSQPSYWTALGTVGLRAGENLEAVKALTKAASLHQI